MRLCSIEDCTEKHFAKGFCRKHYYNAAHYMGEWKQNNPEKIAAIKHREYLKHAKDYRLRAYRHELKRRGWTLEEYNQAHKEQKGLCALCGLPAEQNKTGKLYADHDHTTMKRRALLCHSCNTGLGYFKDNIVLLEKAIVYLRKYQKAKEVGA